MSLSFILPPVPPELPGPVRMYLETLRSQLLLHINKLYSQHGCGITFDTQNRLALKHETMHFICMADGTFRFRDGMLTGKNHQEAARVIAAA